MSMDGKTYVFLCLNEVETQETYPEMDGVMSEPQTVYEYDYAEIIEDDGILDLNDVAENPENYLDYTPGKAEPDSLEKCRSDIDYMAMELGVEL